ncbi:unnamed protein product [Spirodela intermedia]|uniref:Uncharacterized protein n=1 Tax=Spirodela intermedia TaxID=51605 RepID=A0A7I8JQZ1_SPIIN|nr:unnamed protein product [Spirodela intermedia]CAA6672607.1 unnamed protein product [Spirodela intermedia]
MQSSSSSLPPPWRLERKGPSTRGGRRSRRARRSFRRP